MVSSRLLPNWTPARTIINRSYSRPSRLCPYAEVRMIKTAFVAPVSLVCLSRPKWGKGHLPVHVEQEIASTLFGLYSLYTIHKIIILHYATNTDGKGLQYNMELNLRMYIVSWFQVIFPGCVELTCPLLF